MSREGFRQLQVTGAERPGGGSNGKRADRPVAEGQWNQQPTAVVLRRSIEARDRVAAGRGVDQAGPAGARKLQQVGAGAARRRPGADQRGRLVERKMGHGALERAPGTFNMVQQHLEHRIAAAQPGKTAAEGGDARECGRRERVISRFGIYW